MDKKNTMLLTVIAVATLLVAVVGATFAYFNVSSDTTTATTSVVTKVEAVGTVAVANGSALKLDITAAQMSETLKGKDIKVANEIIEDFYELIKGNYPEDEDRLGDAIVYVNIHNYPPRAKCATLAWRAAGAIIHGEEGESIDE